ncbi:MAG TPA: hypothetical protein VMT85_01120 [Thermoanaerobaculia bacterium]|nr:hypothetical protein [Thermoanaerobaculia bacterium]
MNSQLLLLASAALGVGILAVQRWRQALIAAMVLLVLEGAIRKWLLPAQQDFVYFAKDALLLAAYAGYVKDRGWARIAQPRLPGFYLLLAASTAWYALEVFNPQLPNLLVGLLGFKAYLLYAPLVWVIPAAFPETRSLARFVRWYALLAIPVGLLASLQFLAPGSSPLNTYARLDGGAGPVGFGTSSFIRVTGTFSYITGFATYLQVTALLLLVILAVTRWRLRGNLLVYGALGLTLTGMFMSGSRGPVYILALTFPMFLWMSFLREREKVQTFARVGLGIGILVAMLGATGTEAAEAFYQRATQSTDTVGRIFEPFKSPIDAFDRAGLFGVGIGATHQTAVAVTPGQRPYSWLEGAMIEAEPGRVMLELGIVGFVLNYALRFYLVVVAFQQIWTLRGSFHRAIAISAFLFFLVSIPGGMVFNVTADLYYWFFAGLLTLVMRLDLRARAAVRRSAVCARNESPERLVRRPPDLRPAAS